MAGAETRTFSKPAVIALIGVGLASFLFAFVLAAFGGELGGRKTLGADSFSRSALGHSVLVEFMQRTGVEVHVRLNRAAIEFGPGVPLVVAEPPLRLDQPIIDRAREEADLAAAPLVVVLPKWTGIPDAGFNKLRGVHPIERIWLRPVLDPLLADPDYDATEVVLRRRGRRTLSCETTSGAEYTVELESPQFVAMPQGWEPLVQCDGRALVARLPGFEESSPVYLIADPDVLNNHGMTRGDHPLLMHDLLVRELRVRAVVIDETVHGFGRGSSLTAELLRFPLVLTVAHGLAVVGLIVWTGFGRFGKPVPPTLRLTDGKQVLIDNAAQLLSLGQHSRDSLRVYFDHTVRVVGAHYFFRADMPMDQLLTRLQGISDARGVRVDLAGLSKRMHRAGTGRAGSSEQAVRLARRLHGWRQEITDGSASDS